MKVKKFDSTGLRGAMAEARNGQANALAAFKEGHSHPMRPFDSAGLRGASLEARRDQMKSGAWAALLPTVRKQRRSAARKKTRSTPRA